MSSSAVRQWSQDLAMGVRFTFTGGREGWLRAVLTAIGVGLGVALLLLTTAVPNALSARDARDDAREDLGFLYSASEPRLKASDKTVVVADVDTEYHDKGVRGRLLQPEGASAPLPPGVAKSPAPGEMVVSPALAELLKSDDGKLLRDRLPYRTVGTIGQSGLIGSAELAYYAGAEGLAERIDGSNVGRIDFFGPKTKSPPEELDPILLLLILVVFVALLMPVAVFIATAVRFGGERRDRRLAALRLVGSDSGMTRRIAAGEAFAGAVLGLLFGTVFFLIGREVAGSVELYDISVFPSDLNPSPVLALLVALAVPAAAVLVTLFTLRGVVIEPLGVVRTAKPARRRLWWRLLLPLGGLALLAPMVGMGADSGQFNEYMVTGGVVLLLVGITALLPWIVEIVVARLGSGAVSWQLAVRRLQLSSGTAARMVNGIAVAVAGAIALQMLFAGVESRYTETTGLDTNRAQLEINLSEGIPVTAAAKDLKGARGVDTAVALFGDSVAGARKDPEYMFDVTIGDCADLRELARITSCRDGDVFLMEDKDGYDPDMLKLAAPGNTLYFDPTYTGDTKGTETPWTLPADVRKVKERPDSLRSAMSGLLATPGAVPAGTESQHYSSIFVRLDPKVPDALEEVRNAAAAIDPVAKSWEWESSRQADEFTSIRTGLLVGASAVLVLVGASLLVTQLEQLRERKKLLSALVAFGTRRRTLGLSVLWQTAIPIVLGLFLATLAGLTLGAVLLRMTAVPVAVDWASVLTMNGVGAGVVVLVTLLSLPPLLRLLRPDGLRTE
ncbi:ABC transporter permease [Streptomyces ipomoeae]|uniref:ABC transporter permease n=2 Tax=Streptomyces ipomoeae TaxID=103232 RepID=A0AAE8W6Z3_9ACTN|nr:FtsX-like permease family protein [Streptomyces ipomoeae]EKX65559.1 putative membrane protein [Streptomyces ipomoeae 91-03]MDX2697092.1 FtsX-like permease family protein [Streptomyces ipomoeae]MDX2826488.1 FtsX-like permease family protein [Streptomyces ipomoeae]MDX2842392.1 FtsX-like permease family protein [Streptomyces ipomoeae]MDX2872742.1 FtsX-like permease family protein [Streptomyces ipomoeae]